MAGTEAKEVKVHVSGVPKIRDTLLGVPAIRITVVLRLYWVTPICGNYDMF